MMRKALYTLLLICVGVVVWGGATRPAWALCIYCPMCEIPENQKTRQKVTDEHNQQRVEKFGTSDPLPPKRGKCQQHGTRRLGQDQNWWIDNFLNKGSECGGSGKDGFLLGALQLMTEEMTAIAMHHTLAVGTMFDAWLQLDTQLTFDRLKASAHKTYRPGMGMCEIGTNMRSLGAAEHNANISASSFANRQKDRALGAGMTMARLGVANDAGFRLCNFKRSYCDMSDNNRTDQAMTGFQEMCKRGNPCGDHDAGDIGSFSKWVYNRDIDFTRTVMNPQTLGLDMAVGARKGDLALGGGSGGNLLQSLDGLDAFKYDQQSIFALSSHLYSANVMRRLRKAELEQETSMDEVIAHRALAAKRSVAQNSFDTIVGMKAMGTGQDRSGGGGNNQGSADKLTSEDTSRYMAVILEDMGMTREDIARMMGPQFGSGDDSVTRPSYYAQLKFIAKMMYQRPGFYVDLYETPANVERRKVAMQGINSILDREIYNSYLRAEMILSQILEMELEETQEALESQMANPRRTQE